MLENWPLFSGVSCKQAACSQSISSPLLCMEEEREGDKPSEHGCPWKRHLGQQALSDPPPS